MIKGGQKLISDDIVGGVKFTFYDMGEQSIMTLKDGGVGGLTHPKMIMSFKNSPLFIRIHCSINQFGFDLNLFN